MERLKQLRINSGLTQLDVSRILGVERSTYVKYERGSSDPSTATLIRLADHFGVSVDYLIGRESYPGKDHDRVAAISPSISKEDSELLRMFHDLDDRGKAAVLSALNHEYNSIHQDNAASSRFA